MARALRITVDNTDYNFTILNTQPITRDTSEIPISIQNQTITLFRTDNHWKAKEGDTGIDGILVEAIGRALGLRYRL